jgi:hypothetical protein
VKCDTPLESSRRELQPCFKPCPNRRFEQRVIVLQSCGSLSCGSFGTPPWESLDKKPYMFFHKIFGHNWNIHMAFNKFSLEICLIKMTHHRSIMGLKIMIV